jgi:hypothetical protein
MSLSVVECHYTECRILYIVVTNVIKLSSVMLNVVLVSVVAPKKERKVTFWVKSHIISNSKLSLLMYNATFNTFIFN